jgi:ketosteroid isomerase-like protein
MKQDKATAGSTRRAAKAGAAAMAMMLIAGTMGEPAHARTAPADPEGARDDPAAKGASIQQIRDAIQAAHDLDGSGPFEGVIPFLAEDVEALHTPPFPGDRTMKGAVLASYLPLEHSLANAAIEGRRLDVTFTIAGNEIIMKGMLTGKLRGSGKPLAQPVKVTWTVTDGRITRFVADASTPASVEGYRLKVEAYGHPAVRPLMDAMMAAMAGK